MNENLRLLRPYLRGLPLIIAAMVIGVLIAKKYIGYTTPIYESTAKLRLADKGEGTPGSNLFKDLDVFASSNKIAAEIEVLKSQILLDKVLVSAGFNLELYRVGKLKSVELYDNSPIKINYRNLKEKAWDKSYDLLLLNQGNYILSLPNLLPAMKGTIGKPLYTPLGVFTISLNDTLLASYPNLKVIDHYRFELFSKDRLFEKVSKRLDIISVDKDVAVIRISYKDPNPAKAAMLVNRLAEMYIQDYIDTKFKAANITVNFLDQQINQVMQKVSSAENNIQSYRDGKSITNITQETETDLRKISQLKIQLTNLKMSLEAIQDLDNYIKNGKGNFLELAPNFEAFTDLLSTEMVKKIKALQAEKRDLLLVYTSEDERVKVIDDKIKDLTSYLVESIKNTRKNLEIKYDNLQNDITESEKAFIGVPEKEKMLAILNREFNIYQQSYNFLNEKKIEAEIAQSAKISLHRIISKGEIAKDPVSPNKAIITIVSALLGMFISLLFIFLVHRLKAKVNDLHTIESNTMLAVSSLTPKLTSEANIKKHFLKEALQLELKGVIKANSTLCLTSYKTEDGAVFNALHLATAMAAQERRVLLIDVENQLKKFSLNTSNEVIRLHSFSLITLMEDKYKHYTQQKMQAFIEELKSAYDYILILNENLQSDFISKLMMRLADVNMVVLDTRLTPESRIVETDLMNEEYKFNSLSLLINRYGYAPSLIKEAKDLLSRVKAKINERNARS